MDQLKEILNRIPYAILVLITIVFYGYDYWQFENDVNSPLNIQRTIAEKSRTDIASKKAKIREAEEFYRSLEAKRQEIRALAIRLGEMKNTLSEEIDVPAFIKGVVTEAKKVGFRVESFKPNGDGRKKYYIENRFKLVFSAVFGQIVVFLKRLANMKRIVSVDEIDFLVKGDRKARYVELSGAMTIKAFRYVGSDADKKAEQLAEGKK